MAVNNATGYNRTTNEPLDALYLNSGSVYASTTEVNSKVNIIVRYTGSMFNVNGELYWYKNGVQDSDLVLFNDFATGSLEGTASWASNSISASRAELATSASNAATASSADQFTIRTIPNATTDTDKFIVSDGGLIKYRTGAEVLSDINAQPSGSYITSLTNEVIASGPGAASATLLNSAVIGKILTGLNITGGTIVATDTILQAFGKAQNQITGLMGGAAYQGVWNASTNSPTITSSTGTKGHYYVVNVAGSTSIDGITDWKVGDWIIFNGTTWNKVDNTDAVSSVNGFVGAVSLTTANIPEVTNLYYTDARSRAALSFTAGSGAYNSSTGVITIPTNNNQIANGAGYITSAALSPYFTALQIQRIFLGVDPIGGYNKSNWDTAFSQTRQWDGGATGLVAATGRTSLGLGSMALENTSSYYTQTQINNFFAGTTAITGYNKSNWDNVYTWYSNNPLSGYLPLTAGASFPLTGTLHSTGVVTVLTAQSGNTSRRNIFLSNLSGDLTVGIEGSTGGATFTGSSAYAALFGTGVNQPIEFFTNNAKRLTIGTSNITSTVPISGTSLSMSGAGSFGANTTINTASGGALILRYTGNTNYGEIATNSANELIFKPNISEAGRFASDGTFLINTTTPEAGYKLIVNGGVKGGAATFTTGAFTGTITNTNTANTFNAIGGTGSPVYFSTDQSVNNSGKRWRFGHTGGVGGFTSFDILNETDGVTALTIASTGAITAISSVTASSFVKSGGTSSQFLKADGSVDGNSYATAASLSGYLPLSGGTLTGALSGTSLSMSGTANITGEITTGSVSRAFLRQTVSGDTEVGSKAGGTLSLFSDNVSRVLINDVSVTSNLPINGTSLSMSGGANLATSSGSVGIGTTGIYAKLTVGNSDATSEISSGGSNTHLTLRSIGAQGGIRFYTIGGSLNTMATTESGRFAASTGNLLLKTTTDNGTDALQVAGSGYFNGDLGLGARPLTGGGNAKWITTDAVSGSTYGGGLISSINGVAKGYVYSDNGFMRVQAQGGEGVRLVTNSSTIALDIASSGAATFSSTVKAAGRTILAGGYVADQSGGGNNTGISFGGSAIFPTDGTGAYTVKNVGDATSRWGIYYGSEGNFSSSVTASSFRPTTGYQFYFNSVNRGGIYGLATWTGVGTDYTPTIASETGYGMYFYVDGTATKGFNLNTSGAATFSSSVTATQFKTGGTPYNTAGYTNSIYLESAIPSITLSNTSASNGKYTLGATSGFFGIWNNTTSAYEVVIDPVGSGLFEVRRGATFSSSVTAGGQVSSLAANAVVASVSSVAANDAIIGARWTSGVGLDIKYNPNTAIGYIDNTYPISAGNAFGDIHFRRNVSSTQTTSMIIKGENANVGIGTTSPSYKLDVQGTLGVTGAATFSSSVTAGTSLTIIGDNATNNNINSTISLLDANSNLMGKIVGYRGANGNEGNLYFYTNNTTPTQFLVANHLGAATFSSSVTVQSTTASSSYTTGALIVSGGVGIAGAVYTNSSITAASNITAYSDIKLKENIFTIDNALNKVLAMRGVYYTRKDLEDKSRKTGVIAQEIKQVLPEVVFDSNGTDSVDYGNIVGVLIEAIKELKAEINQLKK